MKTKLQPHSVDNMSDIGWCSNLMGQPDTDRSFNQETPWWTRPVLCFGYPMVSVVLIQNGDRLLMVGLLICFICILPSVVLSGCKRA